ncbi:MAG: OmpA family protein [Bacteroidales bacterium]|nr:OmpA family protein [Bacteroidales bacterium]
MTTKSAIFSGILILWIGGSTYWYVCKIKKDCEKQENIRQATKSTVKISDTVTVKVNIQKTETDERNELLKEKISKGYTLSGFPYNSDKYENFPQDFNNFTRDLKTFLQLNAGETIEITGYTDNKGSVSVNMELSRKRAEFIKIKLLELGINEEQIALRAEGENNPLADNDTDLGRAQNRRVEIKLSKN